MSKRSKTGAMTSMKNYSFQRNVVLIDLSPVIIDDFL